MKFRWTKIIQEMFEEIKRIAERNFLLSYPNYNEAFKIQSKSSNLKLGSVINQD